MDLRRNVGGDFGSELAESARDMAGDDQMAPKSGVCGDGTRCVGMERDEEGEGETIVMMEMMMC